MQGRCGGESDLCSYGRTAEINTRSRVSQRPGAQFITENPGSCMMQEEIEPMWKMERKELQKTTELRKIEIQIMLELGKFQKRRQRK
jgi:hypothetical protein